VRAGRALALWLVIGGAVATVILLVIDGRRGSFDDTLGRLRATFIVAIYVGNCVWAVALWKRPDLRSAPQPPPEKAVAPGWPTRRWVCGGRIPASIGNLSATWPLVVVELWPGLLRVRVRGAGPVVAAVGAPRVSSFEPATTEPVFPTRFLWSSGIAIVPRGGGRPYVLYVRRGDRRRILEDLEAAGFHVDPNPGKVRFLG
jgi:hypothetical protein